MKRPKGCFTGLQIDGPALDGRDAGEAVPHLHCHLLGGRQFGWPPG